LKAAGMVPMGRPGGRRGKSPYDPPALTNLILSASGEPIDAAIAASALAPLRRTGATAYAKVHTTLQDSPLKIGQLTALGYDGNHTLGEVIARLIVSFANMDKQARRECEAAFTEADATISLSLAPVFAEISYRASGASSDGTGDLFFTDRFEPYPDQPQLPIPNSAGRIEAPRTSRSLIVKTTNIPFSLLFVAADLWADTLARRGGLSLSDLSTPRTDPDAKTPAPRHREPASTLTQPPRETAKVQDTSCPEPRMSLSMPQASACGTAGPSIFKRASSDGREHSPDGLAA
jgi:hypothetical protein